MANLQTLRSLPALRGTQRAADLQGQIHTIGSDLSHRSDHPAWAHGVRWAAIAPTILVLVAGAAVLEVARVLMRHLFSRHKLAPARGLSLSHLLSAKHGHQPSGSPLTYGLAGFALGTLVAGRQKSFIQVWRLQTAMGGQTVRIAISPSHSSDVRVGDVVSCWGRMRRDGTFRAFRACDHRTGEDIKPRHTSAVAIAGATFWLLVFIAALAHFWT